MSLQSEANAAMKLVFDTFKRDEKVTFYKSSSREIVALDSGFNSDFDNPYVSGIIESGQSGVYDCRIMWPKQQELMRYFKGDEETFFKGSVPKGVVKLHMESGAYDYFQDTKAFYIGGEKYVPYGGIRKLGILGSYQIFEVLAIQET